MGGSRTFLIGIAALCSFGSVALAVPNLQLYLEGGVYDSATESWLIEHHPDPVRLWVIAQAPITDVKLSVAYEAGSNVDLSFSGSTTGGLGDFADPSVPSAPVYLRTVTDGSTPTLGDGSNLPSHGIYGPGTDWQEFSLGDFIQTDSPIADFMNEFPAPTNKWGQINVYELGFSGSSWLHFDVYGQTITGSHARSVFAPFSHDADVKTPEPAMGLLFLLAGGLPVLLFRRRR